MKKLEKNRQQNQCFFTSDLSTMKVDWELFNDIFSLFKRLLARIIFNFLKKFVLLIKFGLNLMWLPNCKNIHVTFISCFIASFRMTRLARLRYLATLCSRIIHCLFLVRFYGLYWFQLCCTDREVLRISTTFSKPTKWSKQQVIVCSTSS